MGCIAVRGHNRCGPRRFAARVHRDWAFRTASVWPCSGARKAEFVVAGVVGHDDDDIGLRALGARIVAGADERHEAENNLSARSADRERVASKYVGPCGKFLEVTSQRACRSGPQHRYRKGARRVFLIDPFILVG